MYGTATATRRDVEEAVQGGTEGHGGGQMLCKRRLTKCRKDRHRVTEAPETLGLTSDCDSVQEELCVRSTALLRFLGHTS